MSFTMTIGKIRFRAKSIERIVENFRRWRDSTINGTNTIGTHWSVRTGGIVCGEILYDGTYRPKDSPERPPWVIVEELLAKSFLSSNGKSQEYKAGVRARLEWQFMRSPMECPHPQGSAQADAYVAGLEEGERLVASKLGEAVRVDEPVKLDEAMKLGAAAVKLDARHKEVSRTRRE